MIVIRKTPDGVWLVLYREEIMARAASYTEAKRLSAHLRRAVAKSKPKAMYVVWEYLYPIGSNPDGYDELGVGWAYRIIETGQWKDGFPTETQAKTAAEGVLR